LVILSPYSAHPIQITVDGQQFVFPTVEHYYQAMKFKVFHSKSVSFLVISILAYNAPQIHFDKFVADIIAIVNSGTSIDPAEENFFYDDKVGFSFINLTNFSCIIGKDEKQFIQKYCYMPCLSDFTPLI